MKKKKIKITYVVLFCIGLIALGAFLKENNYFQSKDKSMDEGGEQ